MLLHSERAKGELLKLEGGRRTCKNDKKELPNDKTGVSQLISALQDNAIACPNESNEASSSSCGALNIIAARENVLRNPVILQDLFQQCPSSVLASCRRVNKLWYGESLTTWRTAFPIIINSRNPLKEFLKLYYQPDSHQSTTKPYRNIKFSESKIGLNCEEFGIFWKSFGRNLTTLTLYHCEFSHIQEFRLIIYKSCPILQKLVIEFKYRFTFPNETVFGREVRDVVEYTEPFYGEHKHLKSLYIGWKGWGQRLPVPWTDLVFHFPLLTSLNISRIDGPEFHMLMDAIRIIRKKDKTNLPFQRVGFTPNFTISSDSKSLANWALVEELRLPLTECVIDVDHELQQCLLENTLTQLSTSLNTVILRLRKVIKEDEIPKWLLSFPFEIQLDKLTRLESQNGLLQNFSFLKYTPSLEYFYGEQNRFVRRSCGEKTKMISSTCKEQLANVQLLQLKTLRLDLYVSEDDIQHLSKWMPNIKNLDLILSDEEFRMVCHSWKHLKNLKVFAHWLSVEGITDIKKGKNEKEKGSFCVLPNIAKLKDLEELEIMCLNEKFTPGSVCHLFLHLPSLQHFSVGGDSIERSDVDAASYQRAIEDNALEQWIAEHPVMGPFVKRD